MLAHSVLDSQEMLERIEFVHSHMPQGLIRLSSTCFKKTIEVSQHDARLLYSSHYLRASEKSENMFLSVADKKLTHTAQMRLSCLENGSHRFSYLLVVDVQPNY